MIKKVVPFLTAGLMISMVGCIEDTKLQSDFCPDDPKKDSPGICGCGVPDVDDNGNTIPDCFDHDTDLCPDDSEKMLPGICGCGISDEDVNANGIADCLDAKMDICPEDPDKTLPGVCGCGVSDVDADQNGMADCLDQWMDVCPEDPDKTLPRICGCGVPDVDADGDKAYACHEECDNDPHKTTAGVCGCGIADVDTDGDGVLDCQDACPLDANKTESGVCGCGHADTGENIADDDGDGTVNCADLCPFNPTKTDPGQGTCDWNDTDGDGVEDDNDACIYNPNVSDAETDCNIVLDSNGRKVFEIWSASDLEKLRTWSVGKCQGDQVTTGGDVYACCNASTYAATCQGDTAYRCIDGMVIDEVCAEGCSEGQCLNQACDGNGNSVGSCCEESTHQPTCDGTGILLCLDDKIQRVECNGTCTTQVETNDEGVNATVAYCTYTAEKLPGSLVQVRLMRDIDLNEAFRIEKIDETCVTDFKSIDLNRTAFDGNGHKIQFTSEGARCAITQPIFNKISESRVYDLNIDIDLRGVGTSLFADSIQNSMIKNVGINSEYISTLSPIYGTSKSYVAMLAQTADKSYLEGIKQTGAIHAFTSSYYGLLGIINRTAIKDLDIDLSTIEANMGAVSGIYEIQNENNIQDVKIDIDLIQMYYENYDGVFQQLYSNSRFDGLELSVKKMSNLGTKNFHVLNKNLSGTFTHVTANIDHIESLGTIYGMMYRNNSYAKFEDVDVTLKKVRGNGTIYGVCYYNYGKIKNLKLKSDHFEGTNVFSIMRHNYGNYAKFEDSQISMKNILSSYYHMFYAIEGTVNKISHEVDKLLGHGIYYIAENTDFCNIDNMNVYYGKIHQTNAGSIHGFGHSKDYTKIKNLAVYADIYMSTNQSYAASLFKDDFEYDTVATGLSTYENIASSIRVQQGNYQAATDTYSDLKAYKQGLCFHQLTTEHHEFSKFYYMIRGEGAKALTLASNYFTEADFNKFSKEQVSLTVNELNTNSNDVLWETRKVIENEEEIQIPWLKR